MNCVNILTELIVIQSVEGKMGIILLVIWYVIGCVSFVYWWTKEYDFETSDLILMFLAGTIGILSFWLGWWIHGGEHEIKDNRTLIKKRH